MTGAVTGLLLAAGGGSRMGMPKALVADDDGPWLPRGVAVLRDGGCDRITVVLGARAEEAGPLVAGLGVEVVVAEDWAGGMAASLRTGLDSLTDGEAALVHLVDLPDVPAAVVARLLARAGSAGDVLARAVYEGRPGHPVLIGREHWAGVRDSVAGDEGARGYLARHAAAGVECGDLATGHDVDRR